MKTIPFVISMAMLCSAGVAAVIQADYQEDLDLPGLTSLGPRVEQSFARLPANLIAVPSGRGLFFLSSTFYYVISPRDFWTRRYISRRCCRTSKTREFIWNSSLRSTETKEIFSLG